MTELLGLAGVFAGIAMGITGIVPFLHVNTIVELTSGYFAGSALQWFVVLLVFSRIPFEFIAGVKVIGSSQDSVFSLHPFQKLAQRGESKKALILALSHCTAGMAVALLLFPVVSLAAPAVYPIAKQLTAALLILIFGAFILLNKNQLDAATLACLAGALGIIVLEKNIASNALFFLLSGLFAVPVLLEGVEEKQTSTQNKELYKPQTIQTKPVQTQPRFFKSLAIVGGLIALAAEFLPGISVTILTALALLFFNGKEEEFISLNAAIIGGRAVGDFAALEFISKARSGATAAIMENFSSYAFTTAIVQIIVGTAAFAVLAWIALKIFDKVNFAWLEKKGIRLAIVLLLFAYAFLVDGTGGLIVLAVSSLVGLTALNFQCGRAVLSSVVVFPAIVKTI